MGPRSRLGRMIPAFVLATVLSPMLLTGRGYDPDWFNHLWLVFDQHEAIARGGLPTLFTHTARLGTFYPQFAFYGGTLYAFAGYLSFPLGGSTVWAYVACFALGLGMAYGGWTWLARQAGLAGWPAQMPGLVHVTAAYVLTNAYARGTWPELMATSALPLVAAGGLWLLRTPVWRLGPAAAWVVAVVVFTGSHNLTLVWGSVFLALVALALLAAWGPVARPAPRRVAAVAGLGLLAAAVNAWFLLPDLAYSSRVSVDAYVTGAPQFNTLGQVLSPLRPAPPGASTPGLAVQMPVLALAWALVAGLACGWPRARRATGGWARLAAALTVLLGAFLVLVLRDDPALAHLGAPGVGAWRHLPHFLTYVQFAYRLETYVTLLVCGLVLVALVAVARGAPARRGRVLHGALGAVALWSVGLAAWQVWSVPSPGPRREAIYSQSAERVPPTWSDPGNFRDRSAPVVAATGDPVGPTPGQAARGEAVDLPAGSGPPATTVTGGPYLVRPDGRRPLGRTAGHRMVLAGGPAGPVRFAVARSVPVVAGRWITAGALAALTALALSPRVRARRRRGRPAGAAAR